MVSNHQCIKWWMIIGWLGNQHLTHWWFPNQSNDHPMTHRFETGSDPFHKTGFVKIISTNSWWPIMSSPTLSHMNCGGFSNIGLATYPQIVQKCHPLWTSVWASPCFSDPLSPAYVHNQAAACAADDIARYAVGRHGRFASKARGKCAQFFMHSLM